MAEHYKRRSYNDNDGTLRRGGTRTVSLERRGRARLHLLNYCCYYSVFLFRLFVTLVVFKPIIRRITRVTVNDARNHKAEKKNPFGDWPRQVRMCCGSRE